MEKKIYLMPRRSGKSTLAEYEFNKEPKSTMFIGYNNNMLQHIDSFKNNDKYFFTQRSNFKGFKFSKAVIDEYLLFDLKGLKNVYENLYLLGVKEVIAFTTPKQFDKDAIEWIKSLKSRNLYWRSELGLKEMPISIRIRFESNKGDKNERLFEHLDKIHFNFLTDTDTEVIFKPNKYKPFNEPQSA